MSVALIDADIIAYQAATVSQVDCDWGDGEQGVSIDLDAALVTARQIVEQWTEKARCGRAILCFSSKDQMTFRAKLYPEYKSNRRGKERPVNLEPLKDILETEFKSYRFEGLEGDDVIGIIATSGHYSHTVIVSLDKDMETIPATIFNPRNDRRPRRISPQMANTKWLTQTLTGDTADGYPGLPGVGPVKAEKILAEAESSFAGMWAAVVAAYEAKDLTEDDAILQARLARILRASDFDREQQRITLWHPKAPTSLALSTLPPKGAVASSPSTPQPKAPAKAKSQRSSNAASDSGRSSSRARSKR
jgi:5'-3' exonuclease